MEQPPPPPPSAPPQAPYPAYGYPQLFGVPQAQGWTPPPPVHRRRWWIWGCGGCGAIALLAAAVVVFFVIRIFSSSPLRQFPTEAGAVTTRDNLQSTNNGISENLLIVDPHSLADVETYYQQTLHQNGWTTDTVEDPSQARSGDTWTIGRTATPSQQGQVTFTTAGTSTDIAIVFNY
jgi:hypothetical protein